MVAWARDVGAISEAQAKRTWGAARQDPAQARQVLKRAVLLREALYRIFADVTQGHAPRRDDLKLLNHELAKAMAYARVVNAREGFRWLWDDSRLPLDHILWPVVRSAADLLTVGPLQRVRECPGAGTCGWMFLDVSKSGKRRWCEMSSCGNRAKARRHYSRVSGARTSKR
ncbi:MAG: CGNR zinc finger domain-containing protein [Fimbriimonadales bacterium]